MDAIAATPIMAVIMGNKQLVLVPVVVALDVVVVVVSSTVRALDTTTKNRTIASNRANVSSR